jgi:hypothetical protein
MSGAAFGCVKNTIRLRSGRYFDFMDPQPDQFTIEDIAGALAKICRFGGQIERFYSVAEHCCLCASVAFEDGLPLPALKAVFLHDAAEAFCGDVVKPLKVMLPEYGAIERRVEAVIQEKFGVDFEAERNHIISIDRGMLMAERRALFSPDRVVWTGENEARRLAVTPCGWLPPEAEAHYLRWVGDLWG